MRGDVSLAAAYFIGLVDPITGAELQARNVARVLRLGEPRLIARAAVTETFFLAAQGAEARARAHAELALGIANRLGNAEVRAFATIGLAGVDYFCRCAWRSSLAHIESVGDHYRARPLLSIFELDIMQTYACFNLLYLGEMSELARRLFAHLREADRRGDAYAGFVYRTRLIMAWLARGDVNGARRALEQADASWSLDDLGYHVQHLYRLHGRCDLACYQGDLQAAARALAEDEPRMRRSHPVAGCHLAARGRQPAGAGGAVVRGHGVAARATGHAG